MKEREKKKETKRSTEGQTFDTLVLGGTGKGMEHVK